MKPIACGYYQEMLSSSNREHMLLVAYYGIFHRCLWKMKCFQNVFSYLNERLCESFKTIGIKKHCLRGKNSRKLTRLRMKCSFESMWHLEWRRGKKSESFVTNWVSRDMLSLVSKGFLEIINSPIFMWAFFRAETGCQKHIISYNIIIYYGAFRFQSKIGMLKRGRSEIL